MKNPILTEINPDIMEEIADNTIIGGIGSWAQLSPLSKAFGNKGAVCTGTIECQNNCN